MLISSVTSVMCGFHCVFNYIPGTVMGMEQENVCSILPLISVSQFIIQFCGSLWSFVVLQFRIQGTEQLSRQLPWTRVHPRKPLSRVPAQQILSRQEHPLTLSTPPRVPHSHSPLALVSLLPGSLLRMGLACLFPSLLPGWFVYFKELASDWTKKKIFL